MTMPGLQQYPENLKLIKNVEDQIVFLFPKVFNPDNFSSLSYKQEIRKSLLQRSQNQKHEVRIQT